MKLLAQDIKKASKYGAWVGFGLAIVCQLVPDEYKAICNVISQLCTGGF